jgi:hypothetical protein
MCPDFATSRRQPSFHPAACMKFPEGLQLTAEAWKSGLYGEFILIGDNAHIQFEFPSFFLML